MERPTEPTTEDRAVGLYNVVYAHETFEEAAQALFELDRNAVSRGGQTAREVASAFSRYRGASK